MLDEKRTLPDHESDPAHTPDDGWVEEGGASHLGPATHIAAGHPRGDAEELEGLGDHAGAASDEADA